MADAPKILGSDTLRQTYPKLNAAIDNSNEAITEAIDAKGKAESAVQTAASAEVKADSVQAQFNQVVIEGDSSVEAAQARVKEDGTSFTTLRERLNSSDAQLAETAKRSELNAVSQKVTILDRLPASVSGLLSGSLLAVPKKSLSISWEPASWQLGSLASGTGAPFDSSIRIRTPDYLSVVPLSSYVVFLMTSADDNSANESMLNVFYYQEDNTFITSSGWLVNGATFTVPSNATKIKLLVRNLVDNVTITTDYITAAKPILSKSVL